MRTIHTNSSYVYLQLQNGEEIEIALRSQTTGYAAVGWRPSGELEEERPECIRGKVKTVMCMFLVVLLLRSKIVNASF